jgi:hypothetical protein
VPRNAYRFGFRRTGQLLWAAGHERMSIASSIFLIAVGAILRYAVTFNVSGVDREAVGLILMIAGFAGLGISLIYQLLWTSHRSSGSRSSGYDDRYERPPPSPHDDRTRRLR